jgi:hypothetical protein
MTETRSPVTDARPTRLSVDPGRLQRMWAMTPAQRVVAARAGQLSLGEMQRWAARCPHEVPLVDGEYFFIVALLADNEPATAGPACESGQDSTTDQAISAFADGRQ